jgi:hypothetical protein
LGQKVFQTKVSFGRVSFGDRPYGDRSFRGTVFGDLTVYPDFTSIEALLNELKL